eukprot:4820292-Lingulodinium_polyedra.AAC.1
MGCLATHRGAAAVARAVLWSALPPSFPGGCRRVLVGPGPRGMAGAAASVTGGAGRLRLLHA